MVLGLVVKAALVFGLLGLTLWVLRRVDLGRTAGRSAATVQVLSTTRLAKGASLAVVRIGDASYAVGVTEHAVSLLVPDALPVTAAAPQVAPEPARTASPSFAAALQAQVQQLVPSRSRTPGAAHAAGSADRS